jgi:hypothetical protein
MIEYSPITCSWNIIYTFILRLAKWHKNKIINKAVNLFTFCEHQLHIPAAYVQRYNTRNIWLQGLINQIILQHIIHHHHHHTCTCYHISQWHCVTLHAEKLGIRKCLLTLPLAKPRQNTEAILKIYELLIYGDIHCITDKFCKSALKGGKP